MANILNGFLDNFKSGVTNPKGNLGDAKHAARLYVDNAFSLAPKNKFLFFVNFTLSKEAQDSVPILRQKHMAELNMLAKTIDLPQFSANVDTKNQYNRKKIIQTSIDYTPVNIVMHDDNLGLTTLLLEAYYKYYFRDSGIINPEDAYDARNTYQGTSKSHRYGLDNNRTRPFFDNIKLYQLSRQQFTEFTLINPMVERWGHDSMDQSDSTGITENTLILNYEAVLYNRGIIGEDLPATFATTHYDKTPSPLSIEGGGVSNLLGPGGVLDGSGPVLGDLASGKANLGTLISGANTIKNAKGLSKQSLIGEGVSVFDRAVTNAGKQTVGGIPGTHFPKDARSTSTGNTGPESSSANSSNSQVTNAYPPDATSHSIERPVKIRIAQAGAGLGPEQTA